MKEALKTWLPIIIGSVTVGGMLWGVVGSIATKEYHNASMAPIQKSMENIESSAVVERIRGLLRSRCGGNFPVELHDILEQQLARYEELTGREFRQGECRDGSWYTAAGVRG